jgi:hypothetical protein
MRVPRIVCFREEPVGLIARIFEIRIMEEKHSGSVGHVTGIPRSTYMSFSFC